MSGKVGFIGLGIMGRPMAMNLIKSGYDLWVNDINESIIGEFKELGARGAGLDEIGENCDVIFTILPNGSIVEKVLFGEKGVSTKIKKGSVVVDMSSVSFDETRKCCERLVELGVDFLDAPVSGGEPKAIDGTLAFMVGGKEEAFNRVMQYLKVMGASVVLTGESGSGSITKLVNQIIVNMNIAVVGEALVFAQKAGADAEAVYDAIKGGLAGSAVLDAKAPLILERQFKPGGKISINHKDIKNVINTAHAMDIPLPFTAQLFEIMQSLKIMGCFDDDHGAIVKYFEKLAGVKVEKRVK